MTAHGEVDRARKERAAPAASYESRHVAEALGVLEGEAAGMRAEPTPAERESRGPADAAEGSTYFEQALLKEPVWKAWIPTYFFLGGAAGACAAIGAAADIAGGSRRLVHAARWVGLASIAGGTVCLVADLGRPSRFMNMLRVFRPTSPMNVGSWVLSAAGASTAASALLPLLGAKRLASVAGVAAGAAGLPLAGYTAVLISNTAVPIWKYGSRSLPALFHASALASAASMLELVPLVTGDARARRTLRTLGAIGKAAELAAGIAFEREVTAAHERIRKPLEEGRSSTLWKASKAMTAASLALGALGTSRTVRRAGALLGVAGALTLRFAVMEAGKASARDPLATTLAERARAKAEAEGRTVVPSEAAPVAAADAKRAEGSA